MKTNNPSLNEYQTGFGTTRDMWRMVSAVLDGEPLPESINAALTALCAGDAIIVPRDNDDAD
jgi:hypothetical protein